MRQHVAAALVALTVTSTANAQVEMRYSHLLPPTHPTFNGLQQWVDSIAEASGGKLQVRIYPNEQLGKAKDHYDMVRDGVADAGWVVPGYTPGRFPIVTLLEFPFIASNGAGGSAAFDSWYRRYATSEMKDVHYCLGFLQDPGGLHTRMLVHKPEDLRGLKLRSPTVPMKEFFDMVGANSMLVPAPQVREMIERGAIEGAALAWQSAITLGVTKTTLHHLDAPIYTVPVVYLINKNFYHRQPANLRKVIDAHCTPKWSKRIGTDWALQERDGRKSLQNAPSHIVKTLAPADLLLWRAAAGPLLNKWRVSVKKTGADPESALHDLQTLLRRHAADY